MTKTKNDLEYAAINIKIGGADFQLLKELKNTREFFNMSNRAIVLRILHNFLQDQNAGDKPVRRVNNETRPVRSSADVALENLAKKTAERWQEAADKERAMDLASGFVIADDESSKEKFYGD